MNIRGYNEGCEWHSRTARQKRHLSTGRRHTQHIQSSLQVPSRSFASLIFFNTPRQHWRPCHIYFLFLFYDNIQFNSQVPSCGLASLIIFNTDFFLLVITIDICLKGGCPSLQGRFSGAILREDLIKVIAVLIRMIRFGDRKGSAEAIVLCNMDVSLIDWLKVAIDR